MLKYFFGFIGTGFIASGVYELTGKELSSILVLLGLVILFGIILIEFDGLMIKILDLEELKAELLGGKSKKEP